MKSQHLPALDGLRGIAILMVFFFHYASGAGLHHPSPAMTVIRSVSSFGWAGVDLFFVLSGFLITGILYDTRDDPGYYKTFYARRALRIFPIFYLCALIAFIVGSQWRLGHLAFLFYVGYPAALIAPSLLSIPVLIGHLWSLSAEEQFYLMWPYVLAKVRRPLILCASGFVGSLILRSLIIVRGGDLAWVHFSLPCRLDALAVGAALALLWRSPWKASVIKWSPAILFGTLAGACAVVALHNRGVMTATRYSFADLGFGAILVIALTYPKLFSISLLRMFGRYSYGLYLFHIPLIPIFEPLKDRLHFAYVPFCLLANLLIAAASFHFFEQPILKLKRYFSYNRPSHLSVTNPGRMLLLPAPALTIPPML